jgi:hypothetical protein
VPLLVVDPVVLPVPEPVPLPVPEVEVLEEEGEVPNPLPQAVRKRTRQSDSRPTTHNFECDITEGPQRNNPTAA